MLWKLQQLHLLPVSLGGLIQRLGPCWALLRSLSRDDPCQAVPAQPKPTLTVQQNRNGRESSHRSPSCDQHKAAVVFRTCPVLRKATQLRSFLSPPCSRNAKTWSYQYLEAGGVGHSTTTHLQSAYLPGFKWILLGDIGTYPTVCFELLLLAF